MEDPYLHVCPRTLCRCRVGTPRLPFTVANDCFDNFGRFLTNDKKPSGYRSTFLAFWIGEDTARLTVILCCQPLAQAQERRECRCRFVSPLEATAAVDATKRMPPGATTRHRAKNCVNNKKIGSKYFLVCGEYHDTSFTDGGLFRLTAGSTEQSVRRRQKKAGTNIHLQTKKSGMYQVIRTRRHPRGRSLSFFYCSALNSPTSSQLRATWPGRRHQWHTACSNGHLSPFLQPSLW